MSDERKTVQEPMIKYAEQIGWQRLSKAEALSERRGNRGRFLYDTLKRQLLLLNPGVLNEQQAEEVMRQLNLLKPTIEGNHGVYSNEEVEKSELECEKRRAGIISGIPAQLLEIPVKVERL